MRSSPLSACHGVQWCIPPAVEVLPARLVNLLKVGLHLGRVGNPHGLWPQASM
jgi:hypothetical protein